MNTEQITQKLSTKRGGQFFTVTIQRECKTLKGAPKITKRSIMQGIIADYSRRKEVREAIESGERDAPDLPKGMISCEKIGGAKIFKNSSGQEYLSVSISGNKQQDHYFLGGKEVDKIQVEDYLAASEKQEKPTLAKMVKVENIIEVS